MWHIYILVNIPNIIAENGLLKARKEDEMRNKQYHANAIYETSYFTFHKNRTATEEPPRNDQ